MIQPPARAVAVPGAVYSGWHKGYATAAANVQYWHSTAGKGGAAVNHPLRERGAMRTLAVGAEGGMGGGVVVVVMGGGGRVRSAQ